MQGPFPKWCTARKTHTNQKKICPQRWARGLESPDVSLIRGATVEEYLAICMIEDITEQKQAEKEIRTYQEQLRSVASELSLTEERERRRLATDLHDHVGQILALAQIKLGAIRQSASSTQLVEPMDEVRRLIEQTIQYTRSLSFELSPPILYDLGFEAAVEWLAELTHEQQGITVKVQADRSAKPMNDEIRIILFQTVRELLANVVNHANAKHIQIFIAREDTALQVKIEDDGLGLGVCRRRQWPVWLWFLQYRRKVEVFGWSPGSAIRTGLGNQGHLTGALEIMKKRMGGEMTTKILIADDHQIVRQGLRFFV